MFPSFMADDVDRVDDHDLDIYWPGHHGGHVIFSARYIPALIVCIDRYLLKAPLVARDPPIEN